MNNVHRELGAATEQNSLTERNVILFHTSQIEMGISLSVYHEVHKMAE